MNFYRKRKQLFVKIKSINKLFFHLFLRTKNGRIKISPVKSNVCFKKKYIKKNQLS